jgi:hypothetical protein
VSSFRTARLAARGLSTFCEAGEIPYGSRSPRRDPHPKTAGLWPSALAAATYASGKSVDARLTMEDSGPTRQHRPRESAFAAVWRRLGAGVTRPGLRRSLDRPASGMLLVSCFELYSLHFVLDVLLDVGHRSFK